jgi:peptide/nickel transport system substrate-binding protein
MLIWKEMSDRILCEIMNKSIVSMLFFAVLTISLFAAQDMRAGWNQDTQQLYRDSNFEPIDLDPAWAYDTASAELLMNVYETLLWFNRTHVDSFVPVLATSWAPEMIDFTDPTTGLHFEMRWTFTLSDVPHYFHYVDGTVPGEGAQVTADDIEYSFHRMLVTDARTGPAWMFWEPLTGGYSAQDLNASLPGPYDVLDPDTGYYWSTYMDEAIDLLCESNATHVWFNLLTPYEPFLQIVARQWGSVVNRAWCMWHGDWNGNIDDGWVNYHDPDVSPLYSSDSHSPGPNLDAALGSGPYMLDYWDKGMGNSWSVIKNPNYWRGWSTPYDPEGWGTGFTLEGHVDRFTSTYHRCWKTMKMRFLGDVVDSCEGVYPEYYDQLLGQPGVEHIYPLPELKCTGLFFNFYVSMSSTHMGMFGPLPPGVFNESGAPCDIFNEKNTRLGFAHLFDYMKYLETACADEAISPVTPIIRSVTYSSNIGRPEEPLPDLRKEYSITGEPTGQLAYDLVLAKTYLQAAWGGELWSTGFTMDFAYNEGSLERQTAAQLFKDGLEYMNVNYGTKFHVNLKSVSWSTYESECISRTLPYFIAGMAAEIPDAHNFLQPFMHSEGTFSKWQGYKDLTQFPNTEVDTHIEQGIATIVPAERMGNYTWLQQYYVDNAVGMVMSQTTGSCWQRDLVEGWYYNPVYPGYYVYDLWKSIPSYIDEVDIQISYMTPAIGFELGLPIPNNTISVFPSINVTVQRIDDNNLVPDLHMLIGFGLRNEAGYPFILGIEQTVLHIGETCNATFREFVQDKRCWIEPGNYTTFAWAFVQSSFVSDWSSIDGTVVHTGTLFGDINADGVVELMDFYVMSQAFGSTPGHSRWDVRCDLSPDGYIELMDFFLLSQHYGETYLP